MSKKKTKTLGDLYEDHECPLCGIDLGYALELVDAVDAEDKPIKVPRVGIARLPNGMMYCRACAWFIRKVCY